MEKTLKLGKIEGRRKKRRQRTSWLESNTDSMDMNLSKLREMVEDREAWHTAVQGVTKKQDLVTENNHSELDPTCHT